MALHHLGRKRGEVQQEHNAENHGPRINENEENAHRDQYKRRPRVHDRFAISTTSANQPVHARKDIEQAASVIDRYRDQEISLADASIVVLAHRYSTKSILTLDHRHFDVMRPIGGGRFRVLL